MKLKNTGKLLSTERLWRVVRWANADQIRAPAWSTGWLPSHKMMSFSGQWDKLDSLRHLRLLELLRPRKISDTQYAWVWLKRRTKSSMLCMRFAKNALASLGQHQSKPSLSIWWGRESRSRYVSFQSWGKAQSDLNSLQTMGTANLLHREAIICY